LLCPTEDEYFILDLLDGLRDCNSALGRREDELDNLREIYAKTKIAYRGQHVKTYAAAYRYGVALIEQHYVRDAFVLLHQVSRNAEADLGECQRLFIGLMHTYYLSLWLYHFYGHEGYRKDLRVAVKGLLHLAAILAPRAQDDRQKRHVERLLRTLLTHQLDWSLDDLELDSAEQQIVDRLADLPAASYGMNAVHYMRYISSAGF